MSQTSALYAPERKIHATNKMLKPVKHKEYWVPEAKYPFPPIRSGILLGSSGNGKSHMMLQLLVGPLKGLHSRVIIVSPSVHVDPLWTVWKDFVKKNYDWADELDVFKHIAIRNNIRTPSNCKSHLRSNLHSQSVIISTLSNIDLNFNTKQPRFYHASHVISLEIQLFLALISVGL